MSFILKTDMLFKKQSEDPLKLVQAVCNSNDFRTNSLFSAIDKKAWGLGDDGKEHPLEPPESAMAVAGGIMGVSIPVLMNVLLAEKNEQIHKLEDDLQEITQAYNNLLQQLEEFKEQEQMSVEDSKEEETTQPTATETQTDTEDNSTLEQAETVTLPEDSGDAPKTSLELGEDESMQSFVIEKDAEIISLKHEVAALREELHEKETLLKEALKKLEKMHESMVQSQEGISQADKDKESRRDVLSPAVAGLEDQKQKDTVLDDILESLRKKVLGKEQQLAVGASNCDTAAEEEEEEPKEKLEEEKSALKHFPNILIQKERKLEKEKMYLEKLCSLLIEERVETKHLLAKLHKRNTAASKDNSKILLEKDGDVTAPGGSTVKLEKDETSVESFLITLILKDLERALDSREKQEDVPIKVEREEISVESFVTSIIHKDLEQALDSKEKGVIEGKVERDEASVEGFVTSIIHKDLEQALDSKEKGVIEGKVERDEASVEGFVTSIIHKDLEQALDSKEKGVIEGKVERDEASVEGFLTSLIHKDLERALDSKEKESIEGKVERDETSVEGFLTSLIHKDLERALDSKEKESIEGKVERDETSVEGFLLSVMQRNLEQALDSKERKEDVTVKVERDETSVEGFIISLIYKDLDHALDSKERKGGISIKLVEDETSVEGFLISLILKDLACTLNSKERKVDITEKVGQVETSAALKEKEEEFQEEITHTETFRDNTDALHEKAQVVDDALLTLQRELETYKRERDALLQKLEEYEVERQSNLQIATPKPIIQVQETSPILLHELQTLRQERDALQAHLRSQALKENHLLLDYDMLKNEYENVQVTLQKTAVERDELQMQLNDYTWKENQLDRLRYQAKQSEILRIERDRMRIKLEELAGIEVAYIKLMEKTEQLEMKIKMTQVDTHKERGQGEVKCVKLEMCERASQVHMEDTMHLTNSIIMEGNAGLLPVRSFMLMEDLAEPLCTVDAHLREEATQTNVETRKERIRRKQDITKLQQQAQVLEEYVGQIAVLRSERNQVQTELNQLREEINKHSCAINYLQKLKQKLRKAQKVKEKISDKVLQDIRLQLTQFTEENISLKEEVETLKKCRSQLKSQLHKREKLARQAKALEDGRRSLQKEFSQLQQVMAKESCETNQMLKLADNAELLQLSDMCEELQNFRFVFQQLLTESTVLKDAEIQLKTLITEMDEENVTLGKKVVELQKENATLKNTLYEGQECLRRQIDECEKEISVMKTNISESCQRAIAVERYKNKVKQLNQENAFLKYKILALKEGMSLKQASSLSEEVKSLKFELNLLHKENATLNGRILELSQENSVLKQSSMPSNFLNRKMQKLMKELQQRISFLEKENIMLRRISLSPDEAPSFARQTNENPVLFNELEKQGKEDFVPADNMQALKEQVNQLVQENKALKEKLRSVAIQGDSIAVAEAESHNLVTIFESRLQSPHEVESCQEIALLKSHIIELEEALERQEEKFKFLDDELGKVSRKLSSEKVSVLKNQFAQLQKILARHEEKSIYLESTLAETAHKHSSEEIDPVKSCIMQLQEELVGQEGKCKYLENELTKTSHTHSSEEIALLKRDIAELQQSLERQEETFKFLDVELAVVSKKVSLEEVFVLKNQISQLQKALEKQEVKCIYLENEVASNKRATEEIVPLKHRIAELEEELVGQEEKCKYLENELAETSNKLIESEVKLKLNTEAIIDSTDTSNHILENLKMQLLDEQSARELAEEILQYTQHELDKERLFTKELQSQISMLEKQVADEKQHLKQLSESFHIMLPSTDVKDTSKLAPEMEGPKTEVYKSAEDKAKLEGAIKVLMSENLQLLNKIKACKNQISAYDEELHKLNSEMKRLKEGTKIRTSAEKILKISLKIKQELEEITNENREGAVEDENLQANYEELVQAGEITEMVPKKKQERFSIMPRSQGTELSSVQKKQGEEAVTIIQALHVSIQELSIKLSETAANFELSELKDLEYATGKLETEVKVLKEQLLCGDASTMRLLGKCISEKQKLLGYFRNLIDELNTVKEYSCKLDVLKTSLQQKVEEKNQLETIVKKLESENETLRLLNIKEEDKTLSTLLEVKYVVDCMRRKCQTCAQEYDHCVSLLKEFSLQGHLTTDVEWSNKCAKLEHELENAKKKLSNYEHKLQKVTAEKESQKLRSLSLEKELKHLQHKCGRRDTSEGAPALTETVKHSVRTKDSTPSKSKSYANHDSKCIEKIHETLQLIERMRRKCRRCAAAYEHCTDLLTQAITEGAPSSDDAELFTLHQKYQQLLNEFETKKSVEEELTAERARVLCLQKQIENMNKNIDEHKTQDDNITTDNILDAERKKTEELQKELCEWKKKYEDEWSCLHGLSSTKAKTSSPRVKKMKVEMSRLRKQLKTLQKEEVTSEMLEAERAKNHSLQEKLENLRKEFEQHKIQEQYYIEDMLTAEVQKTVALEEQVTEWKHKYEACWKLMNTQTSPTSESTAHVRAMESEIADLREKLSIYKMERSLLDPKMSSTKVADSQTEKVKLLEEELGKLKTKNKELNDTIEEMETKHQHEVKQLKDKIGELEMRLAAVPGEQSSDYEEAITNVRLEFQKQIMEKENMYEANIKNLKSSFQRDIKNLKKLHDESILRLQKQHDEETQEVNRMHEAELKAISAPAGDEEFHYHNVNVTYEMPQYQLQVPDNATEYAGDEAVSMESLHSSASRSFNSILTKIIQEGITALDFNELSRVHQEICEATSAFVLDAKDAAAAEQWQSSQQGLEQGQLSKCISVLQMEVSKRQKEAEKKVLYFGMQICKERKRICELREQLNHQKEENLDLRNCISVQSQSIDTLKMEKALMVRQSECVKQKLQHYIVQLKKERAKARLLEEEVSKVKSTKKKLENLLEMEKKYNETNETRQALFIEAMKMKLDTAIESEAKLRYQLHHKQTCQMAGDAGMSERS